MMTITHPSCRLRLNLRKTCVPELRTNNSQAKLERQHSSLGQMLRCGNDVVGARRYLACVHVSIVIQFHHLHSISHMLTQEMDTRRKTQENSLNIWDKLRDHPCSLTTIPSGAESQSLVQKPGPRFRTLGVRKPTHTTIWFVIWMLSGVIICALQWLATR